MSPNDRKRIYEKAEKLYTQYKNQWRICDEISGASLLAYENSMRRYAKQKEMAKIEQTAFVLDQKNRNARLIYSAAIRRNALQELKMLSEAESIGVAHQRLAKISDDLKQVDNMKAKYKSQKISNTITSEWMVRISVIEKHHPNWRDDLLSQMAGSKYEDCCLVQRVTGCRTEELVRGVKIARHENGRYLIHLSTAKQRAAVKDDRVRIIRSDNPALERFVGEVKLKVDYSSLKNKTGIELTLARAAAELKAKKNYRMTVANTSKRLFGLPITPKAFRSCITADLRSEGRRTVEIAEFLGHNSTACTNRYSRGLNIRGKGRKKPSVLEQARVKVSAKALSQSLSKKESEADLDAIPNRI